MFVLGDRRVVPLEESVIDTGVAAVRTGNIGPRRDVRAAGGRRLRGRSGELGERSGGII